MSRPKEFRPEPLAEPYVTLSRHTAPITQPYFRQQSSGRTFLGEHASFGGASPHFPVYDATGFCISVWPIVQASCR